MRIDTPDYISANFFMKGEVPEIILPCISPHQVHGKNIIAVSDGLLPNNPEADGVLLTVPNVGASLRFADCAPVLLWGSDWVMILHSGYKGTVLNIAGEGLSMIGGRVSGAWVGPCIGRKHYCRDLREEWTQRGLKEFYRENWEEREGKIYFDLAGEIAEQLREGGVAEENIIVSGIDTFTDERCCSYRRGDKAERMTLYVRMVR